MKMSPGPSGPGVFFGGLSTTLLEQESLSMHCRKCKVKMREERRSFHKQRKWICPVCGRARMQAAREKGKTPGK